MPTLENRYTRRFAPKQRTQNSFYSTPRWKKVRKLQKTKQPFCEACLQRDIYTDCSDGNNNGIADHVVRLLDGGHPYDEKNLFTLCRKCHNIKSNMEGRGYSPERMISVDYYYLPVSKNDVLLQINKKYENK